MAENEKKTPENAVSSQPEVKEPAKKDSAKAGKKDATKNKPAKPSFGSRVVAWFRATKAELKKISWTPRKTVIKNSALALVCIIILGAVLGLLDYIFLNVISGLSVII